MAKFSEVQAALRARGFETDGTACYGLGGGYAMNLSPYPVDCCKLTIAVRIDGRDRKLPSLLRWELRQGDRRVQKVENHGRYLDLILSFNRRSPVEQQLDALLMKITQTLRDYHITPADTCVFCGRPEPECLARVQGYQPVHAACARRSLHTATAEAEDNRLNGNYLKGFLGAVLGAIAGMLPSLLTLIFSFTIYGSLFLLIPAASMFGYWKLGGKRNAAAVVIVTVLSIGSVVLMWALYLSARMAEGMGLGFFESVSIMLPYIFSAEGFPLLLQSKSGLTLILIVVEDALLGWWFLKNMTNSGSTKIAGDVAATLRPNPNFQFEGENRS